ncbi:hypothetical protein SK128_011244 [Halocaridina rubra]|uniref:Uncharacterized protein n=1 Tax=Halocaridina rubra TaxID=373956 RepID=A0AAN8WMI1_HALRR
MYKGSSWSRIMNDQTSFIPCYYEGEDIDNEIITTFTSSSREDLTWNDILRRSSFDGQDEMDLIRIDGQDVMDSIRADDQYVLESRRINGQDAMESRSDGQDIMEPRGIGVQDAMAPGNDVEPRRFGNQAGTASRGHSVHRRENSTRGRRNHRGDETNLTVSYSSRERARRTAPTMPPTYKEKHA